MERLLRPESVASYAELHAQGSVLPTTMGMWIVAGYDASSQVLKDHANFSSAGAMGFGGLGNTMVFVDQPDHTRLRGILARTFTPKAIAALEPRIREITRRLLDEMTPGEPFDIMSGLARPLPVIVIAEMLGLDPAGLDKMRWSDPDVGMAGMMGGGFADGLFTDAVEDRRTAPRDDLISLLVQAESEGTMSRAEVMGACALLFIAGNVTTTSLLGNGVFALSKHPEQCAVVAKDHARIANMLEEVFRWDAPVPAIPPRRALVDMTVDGTMIPAGTQLVVMVGAANRDPKRFTDPDRFDIARPDAASHLAFGAGIHYCLGAPLSRLESRVAMEELLDRVPSLRVTIPDADVPYAGNSFLRTIRSLPIAA